jgi:hypothetical protein
MAHNIVWLKPDRLLYIDYLGHQTAATLHACLDEIAEVLDQSANPVIMIINWGNVTEADPKILINARGHRAYDHPKAARALLLGMDSNEKFQNEVSAHSSRDTGSHTRYTNSIDEAMDFVRDFFDSEVEFANARAMLPGN